MRFIKLNKKIRFLEWDVFKVFNFKKFKGEQWVYFFIKELNFQKRFQKILNHAWIQNEQIISGLLTKNKRDKKTAKKFYLLTRQRTKFLANVVTNSQIEGISRKAAKKSSQISKPAFHIFGKNICSRLDFILYSLLVCKSPQQARLDIMKGRISVNNVKIKYPSGIVSTNDVVEILPSYKSFIVRQFCISKLWRWKYFLYDDIFLYYFKAYNKKGNYMYREKIDFNLIKKYKLYKIRRRNYQKIYGSFTSKLQHQVKLIVRLGERLNQLGKKEFYNNFVEKLKKSRISIKIQKNYFKIRAFKIRQKIKILERVKYCQENHGKDFYFILKDLELLLKKCSEMFLLKGPRLLELPDLLCKIDKLLKSIIYIFVFKVSKKKEFLPYFFMKKIKSVGFKNIKANFKIPFYFNTESNIEKLYFDVYLLVFCKLEYNILVNFIQTFFKFINMARKKKKSPALINFSRKYNESSYDKPFCSLDYHKKSKTKFQIKSLNEKNYKFLASNGIDSRTLFFWSKNSRLFL